MNLRISKNGLIIFLSVMGSLSLLSAKEISLKQVDEMLNGLRNTQPCTISHNYKIETKDFIQGKQIESISIKVECDNKAVEATFFQPTTKNDLDVTASAEYQIDKSANLKEVVSLKQGSKIYDSRGYDSEVFTLKVIHDGAGSLSGVQLLKYERQKTGFFRGFAPYKLAESVVWPPQGTVDQ